MGSGGALIDYDNDGDMDVFLVQGYPTDPQGKALVPVPAGWKPGNRLFRNNLNPSGKLTFTDVTESAGLGHADQGMGVAAGDYDNDGFTDLYVTNYEHNILYHNNGNGTFTDVTAAAGVASSGWSTSAAFIDYDRDGLLDLAVVHYVEFFGGPCYLPQGPKDYCGPKPFKRTVTQLFHNLGNGRFKDVTEEVGLNAKRGPGLGILTGDFGTDGYPGFMVANDGAANHLWISSPRTPQGKPNDRVFHEEGLTHGLAYASDGKARAGMGIADGDIYGDGGEAVIVTNLPNESFTVFQRQPNGEFVDATEQSGISPISLPYSGFGVGLFDMENRGLLDFFSANGAVAAMATEQGEKFPYRQRNLLLRNKGKGKGFEDITASAGPALQPVEVSRAAVFGDVNNDGGVDILVTTNNGPAHLLLNTMPDRGHWILGSSGGSPHQSFRIRKRGGTGAEGWHVGQTLCERRRQLSRRQRSQSTFRSGERRPGGSQHSGRPHPGPLAGRGMRGVATDGGGPDCESARRYRPAVPLNMCAPTKRASPVSEAHDLLAKV